jgi:multidrug efflux pump subunit AcrB
VPPFVTRYDAGGAAVGFVVLSSDTMPAGQIQDLANLRVRPMFAAIPGVSALPAFGGNARAIVVNIDPDKMRGQHLSPDDVTAALSAGNLISPSGNVRIKDQMPLVPVNGLVNKPAELGSIPLRPGSGVFLRDIATIEDSTDIPVGCALVNGERAIYLMVTKRADASTLDVVKGVKAALPKMREAVPGIDVEFVFDQSPVVTSAMWGVALEGGLGAVLTGLMVLVFLRDLRSVIVVVLTIPLALLGAVVALWLTGQTVNLMTLGGLALAVGLLVDEATVEVENIHTQMAGSPSIARAVRRGNQETAVPRLLAMLCILAVFLPAFVLTGSAQSLFAPLAITVSFAMVTSYLLSSTFVPVLSVWLLRNHLTPRPPSLRGKGAGGLGNAYTRILHAAIRLRWAAALAYFALAALVVVGVGTQLGLEIFPTADTGQFQVRLKAPTGTRFELTEEIAQQALKFIQEEAGDDQVALSLGYIGLIPSSYPVQTIYLWTSGPEEGFLRVALKPGSKVRLDDLKARLRERLPKSLGDWLRDRLRRDQLTPEQVEERVAGLRLAFEPGDVINEVMSFGAAAPVEVVVSGPKLAENRAYAGKLKAEFERLPTLRDLQFGQPQDYPMVEVRIDRERAAQLGVQVQEVARSLLAATSSSRFVVPIFWRDPGTGIGYLVQAQVPPARMDSAREVEMIPVREAGPPPAPGAPPVGPVLVRDVATVSSGTMPGEFDRYNMRRYVSLTANVAGGDLGGVGGRLRRAIAAAGEPPKGVQVDVRGQLEPLQELLRGLSIGLGLAVLAILLMLVAYFQSLRLALVAVAAVPAVAAGVLLALFATGTSLNLPAFMGAVTAVGVSVANAILLVTFAERRRRELTEAGRSSWESAAEAAVEGARRRVRPILMTSLAMIAGMVPMALGGGTGGAQTAPLGRAVVGGLLAATVTTLFLLPALFALVMGGFAGRPASLDPDDPSSLLFDGDGALAASRNGPPAGAEADRNGRTDVEAPAGVHPQ